MSFSGGFPRSQYACPKCNGDGKCCECAGSGTNPHLNETEPKCRNCDGSGVCPACGGSGSSIVREPEILDLGLNKL